MASMRNHIPQKEHFLSNTQITTLKRHETRKIRQQTESSCFARPSDNTTPTKDISERQCLHELPPEIKPTYRAYFSKHRIIPKCVRKERNIGNKLKELGLNMDGKFNMVSLPKTRDIPEEIKNFSTPSKSQMNFSERAEISSLHLSNHKQEYYDYVRTSIEQILNTQVNDNEKRNMIYSFMDTTKNQLLDGTLELQNKRQRKISCCKCNKDFKFIPVETQVHHLIPQELFNDTKERFDSVYFKTLQDAFKFVNFDKHSCHNLLSLPISSCLSNEASNMLTPQKERKLDGRTPHNGSHPKYTEDVKNNVIRIFADLISNIEDDTNNIKNHKKNNTNDIETHKKAASNALAALAANYEHHLLSGEKFDTWGESCTQQSAIRPKAQKCQNSQQKPGTRLNITSKQQYARNLLSDEDDTDINQSFDRCTEHEQKKCYHTV